MRIRRAILTGALVALGLGVTAVPSQAQLTTFCNGSASDVTVPGDLVVRAGQSCDLTNVTIQGNATVRAGANLLLDNSTITGNLVVQAEGFANLANSEVVGATRLNEAFGVYSENSEHGGNVNTNGPEFFYSVGSSHSGNILSTDGETFIESARLARNLTTTGDLLTDVYDSVIGGRMSVSDAEFGSVVCASEIDGDITLTGNSLLVQLGPGLLADCDHVVAGSNVTLTGNTADVTVTDSVVRGDLVCTDNDPAAVVTNTRIRGADLCETASAAASSKLSRSMQVDVDSRKADVLNKIETRTEAGEKTAERAGHAFG